MPFDVRKKHSAECRTFQISLQTLTEQLNKFKPASEYAVGVSHEKLSDQVQQRFDAQAERIDKLSETMLESEKATQTNVETLNSLLVGIEILGDNFKKMQEDMVSCQVGYHEVEREYQEMNEQLMQEVPLSAPAETRPEDAVNSPVVSMPPVTTSQFTIPSTSRQPQSSIQAGQNIDADL